MPDTLTMPVEVPSFPAKMTANGEKYRLEYRGYKKGEWCLWSDGEWSQAMASDSCAFLVATLIPPEPPMVKVEGQLATGEVVGPMFWSPRLIYVAGDWSQWADSNDLDIPESDWPEPRKAKPYTIELPADRVAGGA